MRDRQIVRVGEVEHDRALVAVDGQVVGADIAAGRRHPVPGVVAGRALDLDHVGAEVGQQHRAVRPGEHAGEVGDHDAATAVRPARRRSCSLLTACGHLSARVAGPRAVKPRGSGRASGSASAVGDLGSTGRDCHSAQSALTSPAARSSCGRWSSTSRLDLVSAACTVTFMAARTAPAPSRTGTATDRMPGASSSSASAHPRARTVRQLRRRCGRRSRGRKRRQAGAAGLGSASRQLVRVERGQQHLALRGLQRPGTACRSRPAGR